MKPHHQLALALALSLPWLAADAQQSAAPAAPDKAASTPPAPNVAAAARAGWAFFAGRFVVEAAPDAGLAPGTVWTLAPVLGGLYLELMDHAFKADFRMTLGWDMPRKRYAMSLLDSGSGVLDVYYGQLKDGEFTLTNDHGFRVRIQSQPDGWLWQYEYSKDGNWRPLGPPVRGRRVGN